ncbi:MAG TPA: asparagine synthase (glutamine-hydrolyzing) [Planctomycetes bacterium]|nr:asparagine synthase (glutamine-hydrolyzing) [Planctomycetaceae bacterium]HIM30801.1 asparagine synthase (glutamine-hydrolyzing) [Planctomycetota bacterium]
MCGIAGFWNTKNAPGEIRAIIEAMVAPLRHRGPDADGHWTDSQSGLAFGHRRLSILDLSERGAQPMESASGRTVITYNGEIYNHRELRKDMSDHSFRGTSDTETLVEAIERWGVEGTLSRANGMFAFAAWDRSERVLTLARDRLGIKPLYYGRHDGCLFFSSELKAIRAVSKRGTNAGLGIPLTIDRGAVSLLMKHGYIPSPHTIFNGILKLPAGAILQLTELSLDRDLTPHHYWSLQKIAIQSTASRSQIVPDEEVVEQLDSLLTDSIRLRTLADVPLGAFLSGGLDSSLVAATLQKYSPSPIATFTIGFQQQEFDESVDARRFASHLGTDHHELLVTDADARDVIPTLPTHYDEPFADSSQIPTLLISEFARRHVKVSLSGDGGDELFGGYRRYQFVDSLWHRFRQIPDRLRHLLAPTARCMSYLLPRRLRNKALVAAELLPASSGRELYARHFGHWRRPNELVLHGDCPNVFLDQTDRWELDDGLLEEMMLVDGVTYLADDILVKLDRASMAVGLEARVPLLDHRLVEFAWQLPRSQRWRNGETKWLLRQLVQRHIPKEWLEQPKRGFGVPLAEWLRGPLRDWADHLLAPGRLEGEGFFETRIVQRAWQEHVSGKAEWHYLLWDVLMFQAWLEEWEQSA